LLAGAAVLLAGCGKEERSEAVRLSKILTQKQADFVAANKTEEALVASARGWSAGIVANGGGRGAALDENAKAATDMAQAAVTASSSLSQVRMAIYDQPLKHEYTQSVRTGLITEITRRQRMLQDMRALLQQSAQDFTAYKQSKTYKGDEYPGGVGKLDAMLQAYKAPDDAVASALAGLKSKYNLGAGDL
jgi:hypothetical protein